MKKELLLAGMILTGAHAMAAENVNDAPQICKSVANIAAQTLDLSFTDGSWADPHNPKSVVIKQNKKYEIASTKFLGNCDDDTSTNLKETWCNVAGGSPDIYQVDVSYKYDGKSDAYPQSTVIVTFNRGSCHVDEIEAK